MDFNFGLVSLGSALDPFAMFLTVLAIIILLYYFVYKSQKNRIKKKLGLE